jgi:tRNA(Ile)-lysidine synthase
MIDLMAETIRQFNMIEEGDHVVAGISGGADSVCLLLNLVEYQKKVAFDLEVVHVNHLIREDASHDASFVKGLCDKYDIPFYLHEIDVEALAKEKHISTEEAGRIARYEAYRDHKPTKIAVGHHSSDVAETVLLNMCRGTGIHGMVGVPAVSGDVIRPLIRLTRKEIEEYLDDLGQEYCTDSTNLTTDYTRNKIRLEVMPYLEKNINSRAESHISDLAADVREVEEYLMTKVREAYDRIVTCVSENTLEIAVPSLKNENIYIQKEVILEVFGSLHVGRKDIGRIHVESVLSLCDLQGEKSLDLPYGIRALKQYDKLTMRICKEADEKDNSGFEEIIELDDINAEWETATDSGLKVRISLADREEGSDIPSSECTKWLDYGKIECSPMLRTRRPGDYLTTDDHMHKKSLKDYFVDEKIPRSERDSILLLADGSHIMWVLGHRISSYYKIDEQTKRIMKIDISEL